MKSAVLDALPGSRPLRSVSQADLQARFEAALASADGVSGAHCIHEAWMRNAFPSRVEAALDRLWRRAASSIPEWLPMHHVPWLPVLYDVAATFRARRRGRQNLVRLDYSDRGAGTQGVYVGTTAHPPHRRFDQHRAGIRSAGSVLKRGQEVLMGPVLHLQHIARADAVRIERDLAQALADAGLLVEGGH
jgi:hypothetical protein